MAHSSAGGAFFPFPRVPGPQSTMEGSGFTPALCPVPRSIVKPPSEARQTPHSSLHAMLLLCPGKPAKSWGMRQLMRSLGCCCHSRIWEKKEQQRVWLLLSITRHLKRLPRQKVSCSPCSFR